MSEYNPRTKGMELYKSPEIKHCITYGQPLVPEVKPITNHMNNYLNQITRKSIGVINSDEPVLEIQGVKVYKITGKDLAGNPVSAFEPVVPASSGIGQEINPANPPAPLPKFPILENKPIENPVAPTDVNVVTRPISRLQAAQLAMDQNAIPNTQ